jgi:hypothetical protein
LTNRDLNFIENSENEMIFKTHEREGKGRTKERVMEGDVSILNMSGTFDGEIKSGRGEMQYDPYQKEAKKLGGNSYCV